MIKQLFSINNDIEEIKRIKMLCQYKWKVYVISNTGNRTKIMESNWCTNKELCYQTFNMDVCKCGIDIPDTFDVKAYIIKRKEMIM
jgi:hypothetical protein